MDSLIVILLIIIGVIARSSKKKKAQQQAQQQRARQAGYDAAAAVSAPAAAKTAPKPKQPAPRPRAVKPADLPEMAETAAEQLKIPLTKEGWEKLLAGMDGSTANAKRRAAKALLRSGDSSLIAEMEAGVSVQPENETPEGQKFQTLTAQRLNAERLQPTAQHLEGKSHQEHAAHRQRFAEEEARLHREREELKELRNVNLKKLRSAVVMSEVLGKPVALRSRGR